MEKPVTQENINKYKASAPYLKHIKINKNTKGVMLIDDDTCVGIINSEKKSDGVWIQALEVTQKYKGTGIGTKLLNYGINTLGATVLSVRKTNNIALNMHKKAGFKVIDDTGYQYIMRRGNITTESIVTESNVNNMEKFEFIDLKNSRAIKYLQTESYWKEYGDFHNKNSKGEIVIDKEKERLF